MCVNLSYIIIICVKSYAEISNFEADVIETQTKFEKFYDFRNEHIKIHKNG